MGTKPLLFKYPLDLTGDAPTNLIINEPHTLGSDAKRAFVPNCGPFYTDSVKIVDAVSGEPLTPVTQYKILQPYQEASIRTGLDVASVIWINDKTVSTEVLVTYQVVGGEFSWSVYALQEMIDNLDLDNREVAWNDIIGKPALYPPTPHLHDLGDTYGWEYIGQQLEGIRDAILTGDAAAHDELRQQFEYLIDQLKNQNQKIADDLQEHIDDMDNPHNTTKGQVGLGLVENFPVASDTEATQGTATNRYMTPRATKLAIDKFAGDLINTHIADKNNPHQVTKTQVGLGLVDNFQTATEAEADAGAAKDRFMTPYLTKAAITFQVGNKLDDHINNTNNPHNTTKAQVGLGNVDNFVTASVDEATSAGVGTQTITGDKFVTLTGLSASIRKLFGTTIGPHIADTNNPHNTTKAQVGLGLVDNFQTATQAQAEAGVAADRFMTPLLTKQAITAQAVVPLNSHINNTSNPHRVTAAQVGLGALPNSTTRSRFLNSDGSLLTAGGMYDHVNSADHDGRYITRNNVNDNGSTYVAGGAFYGAVNGAWRQLWPPQWQ